MGKKRVKDLHVINKVLPHLIPKRTEAEVYIPEKLDVTALLKYLAVKNKKLNTNDADITLFHALVMAAAKMIYHRPSLNRFVKQRKLYQRDEITIAFVSRREFKDESDELLIQIKIDDTDTIKDVRDKIVSSVSKARQDNNGLDNLLKAVLVLPTPIVSVVMGVFRLADNLMILPKSFTDAEPDFATLYLANLGSIKGSAAHHHLNNFGTNSIFATIGLAHKEEVIINGRMQVRDIVDLGITMDERISDGFRAFTAFNLVKDIVAHPELLDEPVGAEVRL